MSQSLNNSSKDASSTMDSLINDEEFDMSVVGVQEFSTI